MIPSVHLLETSEQSASLPAVQEMSTIEIQKTQQKKSLKHRKKMGKNLENGTIHVENGLHFKENHNSNNNKIAFTNGTIDDKSNIFMKICDPREIRREMVKHLVEKQFVDSYIPRHQNGPDYVIPSDNVRCWEREGAIKLKESPGVDRNPISLVTYLKRTVDKVPNRVALAVKRRGEWVKWTYNQYWTDIRTAAKGFIKLGLNPFHGVGILGFNAPEWVISNLAATFAGGLGTGIYTTNSPDACYQVLSDSKSAIVVVENEQQCKKILQIRHKLTDLKAIVQYTGQPVQSDVFSWSDLMDIGCSLPDEILDRRIKGLAVNQCCSLVYTSGTTGVPKGVMLCHDSYLHSAEACLVLLKSPFCDERVVSYLPLSHVAAQIVDIYVGIGSAVELYFASPEALRGGLVETLKEILPTRVLGVPRVYEKIYEKLKSAESNMSTFKKVAFKWARDLALKYHTNRLNGSKSVPFLYTLMSETLLKKVKEALGFQRVLTVASGAAPVSRDVLEYYLSLDLVISETYGMSECCAHVINIDGVVGSAGKVIPGSEVKIANPDEDGNGEICIRGRNLFMGYCGMEEQTKASIDHDGWFRTGDIGHLDKDNYLFITGRLKELIITAGGENVAPLSIETAVKMQLAPVSNCVLIGDRKKFLSMVLTFKCEIDPVTIVPLDKLDSISESWCHSVGSNATTLTEAMKDANVIRAIQQGIDIVNDGAISNAQRIKKWKLLPRDFSIPTGELGPTLKLKKNVVIDKYKHVIDEFYAD